jgi:hypothetical protein
MSLENHKWESLLNLISQKKCVPFLGAGAAAKWLPLGVSLSKKMADQHDYPLDDYHDLARVTQFLAIKSEDEMYPKEIISRELKRIKAPDFTLEDYYDTPYSILADLNLPLYITTNYDNFMEEALRNRGGKEPVTEFCRWNNFAEAAGISSVFDKGKKYKPTPKEPLVYHLHGVMDWPQSMVLTESDYIDFIVQLNRENDILPSVIRNALASNTLLFLGYSLNDINFRIIFRGIVNFLGKKAQLSNIAVMLPFRSPSGEKPKTIQEYMSEYAKYMYKVNIYWGDIDEFIRDLRHRWDCFKKDIANNQNRLNTI